MSDEILQHILNEMKKLSDSNSDNDSTRKELSSAITSLSSNVDRLGSKVDAVDKKVVTVTTDLKDHMRDEQEQIVEIRQQVTTRIDTLINAFPHDQVTDIPLLQKHRTDHEETWTTKAKWDRRKDKVIEHVFVGAMWAAALFIGHAIWEAVKKGVVS